jgi:Secretion system C-terminal sorting domain
MKKLLLSIFLFLTVSIVYSQKELWGYKVYYSDPDVIGLNDGQIIKVPLAGNNSSAEIVHTFDVTGVLGRFPQGRLFQASNGKLYGVAGYFANAGLNAAYLLPTFLGSVLFEYDLILSKYKVVAQLNSPNAGVIEPLPGIIMGTTNNGNSFYKYDINNNVFTITATIPSFRVYGLGGNYTDYFPGANGELMQASDGNLYFTSSVSRNDPPQLLQPAPGGIYKYDLTTNIISKLYYFGQNDFGGSYGYSPIAGKLVEGTNGKLYGTTKRGGITYNPNSLCPDGSCGILYEFDITTNTLSQKYEFDIEVLGNTASQIMKVSDTKIWGTLYSTTASFPVFPYRDGMIYEYDIPSNTVSIIHAINYQTDDFVYYLYGMNIKATDGNYYNNFEYGVYKYNSVTNTINKKLVIDSPARIYDLIEICRKPVYQEILINTFTANVGGVFTYNVQNNNATTYQWQLNGNNVTGQTTGVLNLSNITTANAGVYTCVMTNECGTTTTAPLTLTVTNLGINTVANLNKNIQLVPNPATNFITIELPKNIDVQINNLKINDILGKEVYTSNENNSKIDVSKLPKGIYIISLQTNYGNWNGKFVKE